MKRLFYLFSIMFLSLILASCSSEDGTTVGQGTKYTMAFTGGIRGYGEAGSRASNTTVTPAGGAKMYVVFKSSGSVVNYGTATYTNGKWEVVTSSPLTSGGGDAELHYFENPGSVTATQVVCSAKTAVYACTGNWTFSKNTLSVSGTLTPTMSRVRFKGTAGTSSSVNEIYSDGNYSITDGVFSSQIYSMNVSISSSGYSDYIYAIPSKLNLMTVTIDGANYIKNDMPMSDDVRSIVTDMPTSSNHAGWHDVNGADSEEPEYEPETPVDPYNGHEYVDLGLSVKWATCNVGASKPEKYGDYYAWGETETKSDYSWSTYKLCNGTDNTMTKYCTSSDFGTIDNKKILDPEDDVAHVKWGGNWRIPTYSEFKELRIKCTYTRTTKNSVNGYAVKSKINGNSIFLPSAGYRDDTGLNDAGSYGEYWSSSLTEGYSYRACLVSLISDNATVGNIFNSGTYYRYRGQSVRPVCP